MTGNEFNYGTEVKMREMIGGFLEEEEIVVGFH